MSLLQENVIITGIPRGGTTLSGALFDSLADCICLSEPNWQTKWAKRFNHAERYVDRIVQDYADIRQQILAKKPILDKRSADGSPVTNYVKRNKKGELTGNNQRLRPVVFDMKDENFVLGMKHNAHYTSVLPLLIKQKSFSVLAIVRHPIPTILSWRTLKMPVSQGKLPAGENFWPELKEIVKGNEDLLLRQVKIYDLFCRRYLELQGQIHLLKYEDLTKDPSILEQITDKFYETGIKVENRNKSSYYNFKLADKIKHHISRHAPHALQLYGEEL